MALASSSTPNSFRQHKQYPINLCHFEYMHLRVSMCVWGGGEEGVSGVGVVVGVVVRVC